MAISQARSRRKASGGRYKGTSKKLKNQGSRPTLTKIENLRLKLKRVKAGFIKQTLLSTNKANVLDPQTKKAVVVEIATVTGNEANRHYVRRNILTKGTIVTTKDGRKVRITSRPGQEGTMQGIFVA